MILLEYGFKGPLREGYWQATNADTKSQVKITGKQASMISMILSGYVFKDDFQPFDAFTEDSLADGRPLLQQATAQDTERKASGH